MNIGVATVPTDARSADDLIVRVDEVDGGFENGVEIIHVEGVDIFRFQSFLTELIKKGKRARASKRKAG